MHYKTSQVELKNSRKAGFSCYIHNKLNAKVRHNS